MSNFRKKTGVDPSPERLPAMTRSEKKERDPFTEHRDNLMSRTEKKSSN